MTFRQAQSSDNRQARLPEGWEMKKLGEVCRLVNGKAYKKAELLSEGKYPVLRVGNLFTNNKWYYSDLELHEDKYCDNDDLIYAWSASFGPRIWKGGKVIYHYHIWKVIPDFQLVTRDYLFHLFEWDKEQIKSAHGTGTTMMHVGKGSMENRVLPIPPLAEQKQIVALLDAAFAKIDQAKANIEQNIANAEELFQSKLNAIFSQSDLSGVEGKGKGSVSSADRWEERRLGEVCELKNGYAFKSKEFTKSGIRLLRNCNIFHGLVDWSNTAYYPESALDEFKRFELLKGDIVLSLDRPIISTGLKLARIRDEDVPSLLLQRVLCIRSNSINGDYVFA